MILHLSFSDGSNPYIAYGTSQQIRRELNKWKKNSNYTITTHEQKEDNKVIAIYGNVQVKKEIDLF